LDIERKNLLLEVKADPGDAGSVDLYASVFSNVDRAGEIVAPGAFKNLDAFVDEGWLAVSHEWGDLPVASIRTASQDQTGLRIVADWHSTDAAQACRTVVKERLDRGRSVKCSIGYRVLEDEIDRKGVRHLKQIELFEASIVNLPANAKAGVVAVKQLEEKAPETGSGEVAAPGIDADSVLRLRARIVRARLKSLARRGARPRNTDDQA
jgi:HK97 family phage prohead protease